MEPINWSESGIIVKQLVVIVVSVASLCGLVFSPDQVAIITAAVTALITLALALWSIHNRIKQPCPPIAPTQKESTP